MIIDSITSFVDGRLRLRHPIFKDSHVADKVKELLENISGIESLKHNMRTGSLLIEYDSEILDQKSLLTILEGGEQFFKDISIEQLENSEKKSVELPCSITNMLKCFELMSPREKRKLFNRSLALSFGVTATSILFKLESLHVFAGMIFLGFALRHIKRNHKLLL